MTTFEALALDTTILSNNLIEPEVFLFSSGGLERRDQPPPFFKAGQHHCAALGYASNAIELPDRWSSELDLFGDFVYEVGAGDSDAVTLIDFEDTRE